MRIVRTAAVAALGLLLVGCGPSNTASGNSASQSATPTSQVSGTSSQAPTGSATSAPTSAPGTSTSVPSTTPAGASPVPASSVDTGAVASNPPNGVWTSDGGKVVGVLAEDSGCRRVHLELGDENAKRVALVVVTVDYAKPGQMCPNYVRAVAPSVTLAAPLGARTVVLTARTDKG